MRYTKPAAVLVAVIVAGVLALWLPDDDTDAVWTYRGQTMGTQFTISVTGCDTLDCETLANDIERRVDVLTLLLSHYEPESELSQFNAYDDTDWYPVSQELLAVVKYAQNVSGNSAGAFDITVAPAVDAWGFGPVENSGAPDAETVAAAVRHIDYRQLSYRELPPALRKDDPMLQIDLSALAKGFAVDQLALMLQLRGVENFLVEIGGEVRTAGSRSGKRPWRIGIEPPDGNARMRFVVAPGDDAIATSGDYRNFYIEDGERLQHTIDPTTARPVEHNLASVSVIAPSAMQADALATLLMVMGPEQGFAYAENRRIPALFIVREGSGMVSFNTPEFRGYLLSDPAQ